MEESAGFFVTGFEWCRDTDIGTQPDRKDRQRLTEAQWIMPQVEYRAFPGPLPRSERDSINPWWRRPETRIGLAKQIEQVGVQAKQTNGHQIHNQDTNVLLKQRGHLAHERSATFRPILVGWTDDLDRGHQPTPALGVVNTHLILVMVIEFGVQGESRFGRDGGRDIPAFKNTRGAVFDRLIDLLGRVVDLKRSPQVNARRGCIPRRANRVQVLDHHHRPTTVKFIPCVPIVDWRTEMITQGHWRSSRVDNTRPEGRVQGR